MVHLQCPLEALVTEVHHLLPQVHFQCLVEARQDRLDHQMLLRGLLLHQHPLRQDSLPDRRLIHRQVLHPHQEEPHQGLQEHHRCLVEALLDHQEHLLDLRFLVEALHQDPLVHHLPPVEARLGHQEHLQWLHLPLVA